MSSLTAPQTDTDDTSLKDLLKNTAARNLMGRMMFTRVAASGFATTIPTLVAVQNNISWLPFVDYPGLSGLAALGIIAASGSAGGLLANSIGHKLVALGGVKTNFRVSAILQLFVVGIIALIGAYVSITTLGIIGLGAVMFTVALFSPGLSGLARAWWHEIGLNKTLARRGGFLEPTLSAIAWSVGPTIAAPLVILTPWAVVGFGVAGAIGLFLLSSLPNPYQKDKTKTDSPENEVEEETHQPPVRNKRQSIIHDWWMPATYSFYHIARALLNAGSTAVLVGANQQSLIGASSAAPSIGHTLAGIIFASKKNVHDGLRKSVYLGLLGQAIPTLLIATAFFVWPEPNVLATILLVVVGGGIIGLLKAPVASAIYPLAADARPQDGLGLTTSRMANGLIVGGLIGPLLGTLIVTTIGASWLLPMSVVALAICALGVSLDNKITKGNLPE